MVAPPAGGAISECFPRVGLTLIVPALVSLTSASAYEYLWSFSAAASVVEVCLWFCHRRKDLRVLLGSVKLPPFPLRLAFFVLMQLICVAIGASELEVASTSDLPSAGGGPHQAGGLAGLDGALAQHQPHHPPLPILADVNAGKDLDGNPFILDADISTLTWKPQTISVVLPCAEEREYAVKTAESVHANTPADVLHEIIIVDDGSNPPLEQTHFPLDLQHKLKVKILRHEETVGLIGAKKTGGNAADGDVVVFFDCHVAPQPNWYKSFLRLIGENWRRLVVPQITELNIDTWTQVGRGGGMAKCYLTWDADFKWYDSDDMYIAVISGGLLGMSKRWWRETGGYDEKMLGWGGENLDQSLRIWLCGGEIVNAADSYVAHMWRVSKDQRTSSRYKRVGDTNANRARAVYAWYGNFSKKLEHYPSFSMRGSDQHGGVPWYGSLDNMHAIRDRLKCRPFSWYLRRFKDVFEDAGLIPQEVFMIHEESSGKCLRYRGQAGTSGNGFGLAQLSECDKDDHRVYWHLGNKGKGKQCCSGLHAWNTDQCLSNPDGNGFATAVCDISGRRPDQYWSVSESGELQRSGVCVSSKGGGDQALQSKPCAALRAGAGLGKWSRTSRTEPLETKLYREARAENPEMFATLDRQLASHNFR